LLPYANDIPSLQKTFSDTKRCHLLRLAQEKNVNMNQVRSDVTGEAKSTETCTSTGTFGPASQGCREIAVRVNGKPVKAKGYLINNTTYLQGLFVTGLFGGSVQGPWRLHRHQGLKHKETHKTNTP